MVSQQDRTFIGRQQELEILSSALNAALSGKSQLVMVAGEPGIGKTRLSQELAALAEKSGAQVLWGWCYEHAGAPPYWPWIQAVRSYATNIDPAVLRQHMGTGAAHIADILPELLDQFPDLLPAVELDPEQTRFRLFMSIASFLSAVSQTQPLVLVLEDLHWADESSLLLLEFIAREISDNPVMVVGTYRDVEVTGNHPLTRAMGSLVRESHFQRVQLGGLSRAEVGEFVETSSGVAVGDAAIDALHQRTEGNPLFVGEVVGSVDPEELARDQSWIAGIPEAVREAILRRLNRLSEPCNSILRAASVIGRDFEFTLLRALSQDVGEDEFLDRLEEALGIGVIEQIGRAHV